MIDIMKNIFLNKGYKFKDAFNDINENGFIASNKNEKRKEYYFIIDVDIAKIEGNLMDSIIDEIVSNYWENDVLKEYNVGSDYKKNTSLIVTVEVSSVYDEYKLSNKIYDIEESPYFFKRYVVLYTKEEKELIKDINVEDYLNILSSKDNFRTYKNSKKGEENAKHKFNKDALLYDIISKLYIKLPFLIYDFNKEEQLPILQERIDKKTTDNQKIFLDIIENMDSENNKYYELFNTIIEDPSEEDCNKLYNDILKSISIKNEVEGE